MTPVAKYRARRDNIPVATGAMEARGGNAYIEDWPNARLVKDAHLGVLWDGTSNINALDAIHRALRKEHAHHVLRGSRRSSADRWDFGSVSNPYGEGRCFSFRLCGRGCYLSRE